MVTIVVIFAVICIVVGIVTLSSTGDNPSPHGDGVIAEEKKEKVNNNEDSPKHEAEDDLMNDKQA